MSPEKQIVQQNSDSFTTKIKLLAIIGILISSVLIHHHVSITYGFQTGPSLCALNSSFDCDKVTRSPYADIKGIPVACFALFYYCFLLWLITIGRIGLQKENKSSPDTVPPNGNLSDSVVTICFWSLPPTLVFVGISLGILHTTCLYCALLYFVNFALSYVAYRLRERSTSLWLAFVRGHRFLFALLIPAFYSQGADHKEKVFARTSCFLLLFLAMSIFFAPDVLLLEVFLPKVYLKETILELAKREQEKDVSRFEDWVKSPKEDVPVDDSENPIDRDISLGDPKGEIIIVEFSDFECPICQKVSPILEAFVRTHRGVRLIFKNYPLDNSCNPSLKEPKHLFACRVAIMARCAAQQGEDSFWKVHNELIRLGEFSEDILDNLPSKLGLDLKTFSECLQDSRIRERIVKDIQLGNRLRIEGTPTVYVNGKKLVAPFGVLTATLETIVDSILPKKSE